MRRVQVHQLRPVAQERFLELVEIRAANIPADQARTGVAEAVHRTEISGPFDDDAVAGIDEAADQQIESLLRAGDHQDVVRWTAEARRNRFAESPLPFGRAVLPHHHRLAGQQTIDGLLKRRGGKAVERRLAGGKRDDARIAGRAHQVADRRVVGLQRRRRHLAAPRKRRAARVGPRRHERPPPDVAAHQPFRLQLAIRVDDRRAADVERAREIALRRQPRAGGCRSRRQAALHELHDPPVHRPDARQRRRRRPPRSP